MEVFMGSRRLIGIDVWEKKWFLPLSITEKLLWFYCLTKCNNAGVVEVYPQLLAMHGMTMDADDITSFADNSNGNIEIIKGGKLWIVDFCFYNHSVLTETSKSPPERAAIKDLKWDGLWEKYKARSVGEVYDPIKF
jgi:hypothetical protein